MSPTKFHFTIEAGFNFELGPKGCIYNSKRLLQDSILVSAGIKLYRIDLAPIYPHMFTLEEELSTPIVALNSIVSKGRSMAIITTFDNKFMVIDAHSEEIYCCKKLD